MAEYNFAAIEKKWQQYWETHETFRQANPGEEGFKVDRPKMYVLDMFPYPSGAGLHVGHGANYTAPDIVVRYMRMKSFNLMHPTGCDAFGLPAEQFAVEHGVHPQETTQKNIANVIRQLKAMGISYDWSRFFSTTDPDYYRWTQWIFLRLFNSWYDPEPGAARPISELIARLESGDYCVNFTGQPMLNVHDGLTAVFGQPAGTIKWGELPPAEQREIIDNHRLAYMAEAPVNWCPRLGTVLANEEVTNDGRSDRGDHPVFRRSLNQWMLRITAYADRLLDDIEPLDWPEPIKIMQRNWIGKSTGADVDFPLESIVKGDGGTATNMDGFSTNWFKDRKDSGLPRAEEDGTIRVYTTRPDTLFGATYMVLAPEHPLVGQITTPDRKTAVETYVETATRKSELERTAETKDKTGVFTGTYAINPVNRHRIPIWVADYVMMGYGTGAIMAVPAHDTRDYEFAQTFDLPIIQVVAPPEGVDWRGYVGDGTAINSGEFDGLSTAEFKKKIAGWLEADGLGRRSVNYKLRDWLFSRQRYWGEPFPIIHCEKCGTVGLPEAELPLKLPEMDDFTPVASDDPEALPSPPLGKMTDWVNTTCPHCGSPAKRELNTMPQWAGSCWYYLRFLDPKNDKALCDPEIEKYWLGPGGENPKSPGGVDLYVGGAEHAVLHLLYSRFWHKVLYDLGCVSCPEPFYRLFNQGMIRSFAYRDERGVYIGYPDIDFREDGAFHKKTGEKLTEGVEKMSKSLKNVVNPDEVIAKYGADTFRLYEMFMGPLDASKPWNTRDVPGVGRFLQRVWRMICGDGENAQPPLLSQTASDNDDVVEKTLHRLIKKVGEDIEAMKFNTAIAAMMDFVNVCFKVRRVSQGQAERFVLVLAPFAPHITEELWELLGHEESLAHEPYPEYDEAMLVEDSIEIPVQVNGRVRGRISVPADASQDAIIEMALADPKVATQIDGKNLLKKIVIPGRLVNLVVK